MDLEVQFAELDGYSAESRACEILAGARIDEPHHFGRMSEVAPGWKLRVDRKNKRPYLVN